MLWLTFGVKSSPYLATQVICPLAEEHSSTHLEASKAILHNFYVDDFLSGADSVQEADHLHRQLCDLLLQAGMTLRKWRTSSSELQKFIPPELIETKDHVLTTPDSAPKALGVHWDVEQDNLHVSTPDINPPDKVTKSSLNIHSYLKSRSPAIPFRLWKSQNSAGTISPPSTLSTELWHGCDDSLRTINIHSTSGSARKFYSQETSNVPDFTFSAWLSAIPTKMSSRRFTTTEAFLKAITWLAWKYLWTRMAC